MTEIISSEQQEVIARELAARDVDDDTIEWGLKKIDRAARHFVDAKSRPSKRRHGPLILAEQIEKVKSLSGTAQDRAVRLAKEMGLDSEAIDLLAHPRRAETLMELARDHDILTRLDTTYFEEIAKRTCSATNRFQVTCIGVWLATGGEVRFSTNDRNDGGPFGRFLTAAFIDAYRASGVRMPTPDGIRKKITRLKSAVDAEGFDWGANFSPEIESYVENLDQLDLIDQYFDLDD
jgi:ribosomal protein S10